MKILTRWHDNSMSGDSWYFEIVHDSGRFLAESRIYTTKRSRDRAVSRLADHMLNENCVDWDYENRVDIPHTRREAAK